MESLTEISEALEECEFKVDIPGSLPIEIFHEVLLYLSPRDLYYTWSCCRKWRNRMESFWKRKCMMEHYYECEDDLNSEFYRNFMNRFSYWEGIYMYNSKLRENWGNLNFTVKQIDVNAEIITRIRYFCGDVIIATTSTNAIWIINSTTGKIKHRFYQQFYPGAVTISALDKMDDRLIVILKQTILDNDSSKYIMAMHLKVWNIETGELLMELQRPVFDSILKVMLHKDLITLITHPYAVYVYNIKKEDVDYEKCCVSSVCYYNDTIVMGNHAGTILMMDLDYTELMKLKCCTDERTIVDIKMEGSYLVCICGSRSTHSDHNHVRACIWNTETKTKLYAVQNLLEKGDLRVFADENRLCYSYDDSEKRAFKTCRLDTGECLLELEYGCVTTNDFCVMKLDTRNPCLLKMWSIKTGELVADLDLPSPFTREFFSKSIGTMKTKSKFLYYDYDDSIKPKKLILKIVNFQAQIEELLFN